MNRLQVSLFFLAITLMVWAEGPQQKFSPEKYQQDLEQFITTEAGLTQQEAVKFFPVYREMLARQRAVYDKVKADLKQKPQTEEASVNAVKQRDQMELEQKKIQQTYHTKFFAILSASKVYDVIKAEDRFHRRMFKNWGKGGGGTRQPQGKKNGEHQQK